MWQSYNIIMASKKNVWSPQEQQILFTSHASMGSKWAAIAGRLPGKDQNAIKNKFYSTLRRGHRKINSYITDIKRKLDPVRNRACKTIHDIFISKLIAIVDRSHEEKYEVKPAALALATDIERMLIEVARKEEYQQGQAGDYKLEEALLQDILEFNKNCKKRKGKRNANEKKKQPKSQEEIDQSEIITDSKNQLIKLEEKSEKINVKTQQQAQSKKGQTKFQGFSFLSKLQHKESTSTIVNVNNFAMMASYFKDSIESKLPCEQLIQSANNMTHSSCLKEEKTGWMYDSYSSQLSVPRFVPNYLTEPSPSPNDPFCPFTFNNIMKSKNISGNNMFEDKISCNGSDLAYSSLYQKEGFPYLPKPNSGEFLIKSADLLREMVQETPALTSSMKVENEQLSAISAIFQQMDKKQFNKNVSYQKQYAFDPDNPPLSQSMFATFAVEPTSDEKPLH